MECAVESVHQEVGRSKFLERGYRKKIVRLDGMLIQGRCYEPQDIEKLRDVV